MGFNEPEAEVENQKQEYFRELDIEFVEEEERPYENKKGINFFGLVRAMKRKASESIINAQVKVVKSKLRKVDTINSILTISVLALYAVEYEIYSGNGLNSNYINHILRSIMLITNGFVCWILFYHYKYSLELQKILKLKHPKETLRSSGLIRNFIIESAINMIICPPFLDASFELAQMKGYITITIDAICYSICLLKSYTILRLPEQYIKWTDEQSNAICKQNKCKADVGFLIKCEFQRRPYIVVIGAFLTITILLGFLIRTYESTYFRLAKDTTNGVEVTQDFFKLFLNCFWFMVVTMMTVGFGDGYPLSHFGRIIALLGCLLGTMITSLMVVSLQNTSALTIAETRVYTQVERMEKINNIKKKAAALLHHMFEMFIVNKMIREVEDEESPEMKVKYEKLLFRKFGLLNNIISIGKVMLELLRKYEMMSSPAEDTVLKLNEGGIMKTKEIFETFNNADEFKEKCIKLINDQFEINIMIEQIIKNQNCLASFITKFNDFYRESQQENGE